MDEDDNLKFRLERIKAIHPPVRRLQMSLSVAISIFRNDDIHILINKNVECTSTLIAMKYF